jgi:cytochrome c2
VVGALEYALVEVIHLLEGSLGQFKNAIAMERSSVVDAHIHGLAVADVRDAHHRVEGESLVSRCHCVHVEGLAARRRLAVKVVGVVRHLARHFAFLFSGANKNRSADK